MQSKIYDLSVTTQGPTYPPSEIMNSTGDFVVVGLLNLKSPEEKFYQTWGGAIVGNMSKVPAFGENVPYDVIKFFDICDLKQEDDCSLYTLPIPLPCNNYPKIFAPEQKPYADKLVQPSYPLHDVPIPDMRDYDGLKVGQPIILSQWIKARGQLQVTLASNKKSAKFEFCFWNLVPNSMYTVMALREHDLDPIATTRPGPLGIPNVFITDKLGNGTYYADMPNPFAVTDDPKRNRITNVVLLFMSKQMSYGGAIGHHGLGGDIHAHMKLKSSSFWEFTTLG
jgi:hypothetical protein